MEDALAELIEFVKGAAPEVWRILIRQVAVEAAINAWYVVASVVGIVVSVRVLKAETARADGDWLDGNPFTLVFAAVAFVLCCIGIVAGIPVIIGHLINPEFYALQYLIAPLK